MVKIFIEDGLFAGAFADDPDADIEVVIYDRDLDSKDALDGLWDDAKKHGHQVIPTITHPQDVL